MLSTLSSLDDYARCLQALKVPLNRVENAVTRQYGIVWDMARLDLLDVQLSGNKLFKLLPFLLQARARGVSTLLSFGGAYSNHLHALAAAGQRFGFTVVALVRGYEQQPITPTLAEILEKGAEIRFLGKAAYARRYDPDFLDELQALYPQALIIPEGGSGESGIEGAQLMARVVARSIGDDPCVLAVAMGTGTSFAGLLTAGVFSAAHKLYGYSALDNAQSLRADMVKLLGDNGQGLPQWQLTDDYCFGGFAKMTSELAVFIRRFEDEQGIPLDPVYTAKLCYAIEQQIRQGIIPAGSRVVALHTGGLQGKRGMQAEIERYCHLEYQEPCINHG